MKSIENFIKNEGDVSEIYKLLIENIIECIWLFDLKNMCFKYVSPSVMELRGLTVEEAMNEKLEDSFTEESLEKMLDVINKRKINNFLNGEIRKNNCCNIDEFQQYCKDGTIKNVEITTKFIFNEKTNYVDILGVSREIKQRKAYNSELAEKLLKRNKTLKRIAITDELTGTNNRYYFNKKVNEIINDEGCENLTLIIFDVDSFKQVNDTWGHDIGDKVLKKIICKSMGLIRKSDVLARWGGDEFVLLAKQTNLQGGKILAEKLCTVFRENSNSEIGQVTASFGVAEKKELESFESWFKRTDIALYNAKRSGGNCVEISHK